MSTGVGGGDRCRRRLRRRLQRLGRRFAGELLQRVLYAHAETHLDPPAASIVVTSLPIGVLAMPGVLPSAVWIPTP